MTEAERPAVLVVDDDADVVTLYRRYLEDDYDVDVATTGEQALETVDERTEVVLLDRRLPDVPGRTVLDRIRERDIGCRVAVVTAVDPDFDIIAMEFDDYLVKPVSEREVRETVDHLLTRLRYSDLLTEFFRAASKVGALKSAKADHELTANDEFVELDERARDLRRDVSSTLEELDDYATAFSEIGRTRGHSGPD